MFSSRIEFQDMINEGGNVSVLFYDWPKAELEKKTFKRKIERFKVQSPHVFPPLETNNFFINNS